MNEISPLRRSWLEKQEKERRRVVCTRLGIVAGFFLLWELSARRGWVDPFVVSSPTRMAQTLWELGKTGELWLHLGTSLWETAAGFTLGTLLGALIAVALWWSPFACRVLEPCLVVLNALPKTALGPVFIVWIGAGTESIIAMTISISLVVTILDVLNGFLATDTEKQRLLRSMGACRRQILFKLVIPANFTTIINALKVNVGLSWVGVIMGEFLVSKAGLGYLIVYGSQVFKMDLVMATVLLLGAAAACMYQGILRLERVLKIHFGVIV